MQTLCTIFLEHRVYMYIQTASLFYCLYLLFALQMDQEADVLSMVGTENADGTEEEICYICRSSFGGRFMM